MNLLATVRPDAAYAHAAVQTLSGEKLGWNSKAVNRSGIRAAFRRWNPSGSDETESRMLMYVIGAVRLPGTAPTADAAPPETASDYLGRVPDWQIEHARQASIVVAMRAAAGEHDPAQAGSLGVALARAGMTELRFMRLLATARAYRTEALKRAYMLCDAERIGIRWSEKEVGRILQFLFGTEAAARRAITQWGADFFAARTVDMPDDDNADDTSNNSNDTSEED